MVSEIEILAVSKARQAFWGTSDFSDAAYGEDPLPHWSLKIRKFYQMTTFMRGRHTELRHVGCQVCGVWSREVVSKVRGTPCQMAQWPNGLDNVANRINDHVQT